MIHCGYSKVTVLRSKDDIFEAIPIYNYIRI